MAARNSIRDRDSSGSRTSSTARKTGHPTSTQSAALSPLEEAIDDERLRLMRADCLLECIGRALEANPPTAGELDIWPLIEVLRGMLRETLNRLEPLELRLAGNARAQR